jgi:hypothetical protein
MKFKDDLFVLIGAAAGGAVGYFAFFWMVRQGFYGMVLPGGLLGFGAGLFQPKAKGTPIVCGASALALGLFTEWRFAPFQHDESLGYFLANVHHLKPVTWMMIAAGAGLGFWIPFRRRQDVQMASTNKSPP